MVFNTLSSDIEKEGEKERVEGTLWWAGPLFVFFNSNGYKYPMDTL